MGSVRRSPFVVSRLATELTRLCPPAAAAQTEALSIYLNNQTDVVHALLVHFGHVHDTARDARILDFDDHVSSPAPREVGRDEDLAL